MAGIIAPFDLVEVRFNQIGKWVYGCVACGIVPSTPMAENEARMQAYAHNAEFHPGADITVMPRCSLREVTMSLRQEKVQHYARRASQLFVATACSGLVAVLGLSAAGASGPVSIVLTLLVFTFGFTAYLLGFCGGMVSGTTNVPDAGLTIIETVGPNGDDD